MKLKKLFAGIVAVAMMATMGATSVFAVSGVKTTYKPDENDRVPIKIVITGTGYGSETVKLEVENAGKAVLVKHSSYTTENAPAISVVETAGVLINEPTDGASESQGTLHIQLPKYDRVGTYVYKFHEAAGNTAGMTYDDTDKWLLVNVYNKVDEMGVIEVGSALQVKAAVLDADPTNVQNAYDLSKIDDIKNHYNAGTFTVTKKVKGNMSDREKYFAFRVTFKKEKDTTVVPDMKVSINRQGVSVGSVSLTPWNDENKATHDFILKHGETATFTNVPYGVTVSAVELRDNGPALADGETNGEYTVTYQDASETTIGAEHTKVEAVITNDSDVNVDTGVILDNAPYIALLTIVAAGAVVMIMKKRRNYED